MRKWKLKCCDRNRASPEEGASEPRGNPERMEIPKPNRRIGEEKNGRRRNAEEVTKEQDRRRDGVQLDVLVKRKTFVFAPKKKTPKKNTGEI